LARELVTPEEVDALAPEHLPALIAALTSLAAHAAARVLSSPVRPSDERLAGADDVVVGVDKAARIAHHSVSWMRKNGHTLPGFRQPGGKGTAVGWSRAALTAWANGGA
jgi:hypothetical protein